MEQPARSNRILVRFVYRRISVISIEQSIGTGTTAGRRSTNKMSSNAMRRIAAMTSTGIEATEIGMTGDIATMADPARTMIEATATTTPPSTMAIVMG